MHRASLQLTEKGLLLDVLQREKDQAADRIKELEKTLQAERELVSRAGARQEATQERLAQAQSEGMLLRQQLEESQNKGVAKERAVTDAQERFSDILTKLRSDCEERVQLVDERNKELAAKAADLRDQVYKLEEEKTEREVRLISLDFILLFCRRNSVYISSNLCLNSGQSEAAAAGARRLPQEVINERSISRGQHTVPQRPGGGEDSTEQRPGPGERKGKGREQRPPVELHPHHIPDSLNLSPRNEP